MPSLGCIEDNVHVRVMYVVEMFSGVTGLRWPQSTIQRDGKARRERLTLFRKSPITRKRQSGQSLHRRQALYCLFVVRSDATKRTELPTDPVFEVGFFEA